MSTENKAKREPFHLVTVEKLSKKYGLSKYFIRQCVNGKKEGETPTTIKKEYEELIQKIEDFVNKA